MFWQLQFAQEKRQNQWGDVDILATSLQSIGDLILQNKFKLHNTLQKQNYIVAAILRDNLK